MPAMRSLPIFLLLLVLVPACTPRDTSGADTATPADAQKFISEVNSTMERLATASSQASWVAENFITDDTQAINARENQRYSDAIARYAKEAVNYDTLDVP